MFDQTSIYIHIPFCVKKCVYCDFYSRTRLSLIPDYIKSLQKEIENRPQTQNKINTIYFGGGTPSLLTAGDIDTLLHTVSNRFSVCRDVEVTLEVNPGTIDLDYLKALNRIGINRLSIGVQSFNDDKLKFLERIHSADQAAKAIEDAEKAGFDNISIDLIYGLFFETENMWLTDLKQAAACALPHLSCYMLTVEDNTPLCEKVEKGLLTPLDSTELSFFFKKTSQVLEKYGYEHYEISNFSKGEKNRSAHNSNYWNMTSYYGFGAAAHSYDQNKGVRSWNHRSINAYLRDINSGRLPVKEQEVLTREQKMMEMILLRLRTSEGLDLETFENLFHVSFELLFKDILESIFDESLGFIQKNRFALTLEGKGRLNNIVEALCRKIP